MKRFRFPLDPVVQKRKLAYENCARELGKATAKLNEEIEKLESIQTKRSETISTFQRKDRKTSQDYAIYVPYIDRLKHEESDQKLEVEKANETVESVRETLKKARIEYEVMLKMKGNARQKYEHEYRLDEQKFLDEVAGTQSAGEESQNNSG